MMWRALSISPSAAGPGAWGYGAGWAREGGPGTGLPWVWFEPVSVAKSVRATHILKSVDFISPNAGELRAMADTVRLRNDERAFRNDDGGRGGGSGAGGGGGSGGGGGGGGGGGEFVFSSAQEAVEALHADIAVMLGRA